MVKRLLFTLLFMSSVVMYGQNEGMMTSVETTPLFIGDLKAFIQSNISYPKTAIDDSIEGIVIVELWIDTTGNTFGHNIIKSIREDIDEEALRVASLIKFATPAKQRGVPIVVRYLVPVRFSLATVQKRINNQSNPNSK